MQKSSPEISGLLYKKRGGYGKMMMSPWVYRLCSISTNGTFSYYDTDNPEILRGKMNLNQVQFEINLDPMEGAPTPCCIKIKHIVPVDEAWNLCCDTKQDQDRWLQIIQKYVDVYSPPADPSRLRRLSEVVTMHSPGPTNQQPLSESSSPNAAAGPSEPQSPFTTSSSPRKIPTIQSKSTNPNKKKRALRISGKKTDMISNEWIEMLCTGLIVNICIYGLMTTPLYKLQVLYFSVVNIVVVHTLSLRAKRLSASMGHSEKLKQELEDQIEARLAAAADANVTSDNAKAWNVDEIGSEVGGAHTETVLGSDVKPEAGQSFTQVIGDAVTQNQPHAWSKVDPRLFNVRAGPDYNRHKKKAPSQFSIYEPFAIDFFCTKLRIDHAATRFTLPDFAVDTHNEFVPPIFIVQLQMPSEPPTSVFSSSEDGPGWAMIMYYRITEETCKQLADLDNASPAVKLFAKWCEMAPQDAAWRGRFKVICNCSNIAELGIPSTIAAYNAKPVLIRRTGSIVRGLANRYMEMDIHVHKFANIARQSIFLLSSRCGLMNMQIGFVVEGRENEELPEAVFACVAVNKPQEDQAEFLFDDE
jgi:hypothetical protein